MKSFRLTLVAVGATVALLATGAAIGAATSSGTRPERAADTHNVKAAAAQPTPTKAAKAAGDPTASQLLAMTQVCDEVSDGKYAMHEGGLAKISVCKKKSAYFWTSDMAIDCDGEVTDECNPDTDSTFSEGTNFKTSTGKYFTADVTHYFVIPLPSSRFDYQNAGIKPGNVGAVIYNGKLVYAVFADLGPSDSIGEASYATARSLGVETDPSIGGTAGPVTFIVFPGVVPDPVEDNDVIARVGKTAARSFLGMSDPTAPPAPVNERKPAPKPTKVLADGAKKNDSKKDDAKKNDAKKNSAKKNDAKKTPAAGPTKAKDVKKAPNPKPTKAQAQAPKHKPTPKPTKVQAQGPKKAPTHAPKPTGTHTPKPPTTKPDTDAQQRDDGSGDDTPNEKATPDEEASDRGESEPDGTRAGDETPRHRSIPREDQTPVEPDGVTGQITGAAGRCVDVVPSGPNAGTVQLYGCSGAEEQAWTLRDDGTIRVLGGCLAVSGGSAQDGALAQVRDCDGSESQQWATDSGRLVNVNAGRCLDAVNGQVADGTPLQIWACSYGDNQQWSLPDESTR
ncbi:ricin-type beta-trefoil lectin domain protein [Rugosimonospora africana]|uniref:Ricin B lectin domain-containing protein n=1 Tax=Rugosimonospora africana TaxID=556532 RepID=A0A8J3QLD2_9ACTN|nr:ricin-type beta-trefoil lectin domain protein [Rugosimonospora africana]GIH13083.1 hypothetical protein Raf01_12550 [Rugosimonospora africana]